MDKKYVSVEIPYKATLASMVLGYISSYNNSDNLRCETMPLEDEEFHLELSHGITKIKFNNDEIIIDFKRKGESVGLYYSAEIFEILFVKVKYNNPDEIKSKKKVILKFFEECKLFFNKRDSNEILCKILRNGTWRTLSKLPKRKMSTIYLPEKQKNRIYNDLKNFFNLKDEYLNLGIPWKRNYLLEGPPGTGKTSLIFGLASEFNLDIYIVNLGPKVDDSILMSAVSFIPKNSILLLEDIDSLFVERKANDSNKSLVSFSGILNVLDGMGRKSGLITFMTTNYKENLDKALIRPSRVDFQMNFTDVKKEQIKEMFIKYFPDKTDIYKKFYSKIDSLSLRVCILQQFFMECKFNGMDILNIKRLRKIISEMDNSVNVKGNLYL
jgi:SpoVK/Ycf46/Vps4 family AAA+-type ATPase